MNGFDKANKLLSNLARASKVAEEKKQSKEKLKKQIARIRKVSLGTYPPKKKQVETEITKLEKYLEEVLEKEKSIMEIQKKDDALISDLQQKSKNMDEKLAAISDTLRSLGAQVSEVEEKEEEILEPRQVSREQIEILRNGLALLEQKHSLLKSSGQNDPLDLARVEEKISSLKQKLSSLI